MRLSGWGRYPVTQARVARPRDADEVLARVLEGGRAGWIARGLGRSYGDSALAGRVLDTACLNHFIDFDAAAGVLRCSAGVSLAEIARVFAPRGWFLPVVPGTAFVTVGGAIAADVHGKNHHLDGCFSAHTRGIKIVTGSEGVVDCSRERHAELFRATCGGMGLTGVVLEAALQLRRRRSAQIRETIIKARDFRHALALFDEHQSSPYSVAWLDGLATGRRLGRSLIMLGSHVEAGAGRPGEAAFTGEDRRGLSVPVDMPGGLLNRHSMRAFNALYYHRVWRRRERVVDYRRYFWPLDAIGDWNRLYGKRGFLQYQFVLPKAAGREGLSAILTRVADSGRGSCLAVLKAFGAGNGNYLSFPLAGYTVALDFKMADGLLPFLDELDNIVSHHGGRVYLAKDARMSAATLRRGYPDWQRFVEVRARYGGERVFHSLQSRRLRL